MKKPITAPKELVAKVEDTVLETYLNTQSIWQRPFELPSISFDLRGCCAGRAYYKYNRIRLNPILMVENQEDFVVQTVPHEVAHLLAFTMFGTRTRIKPHGTEWKSVMLALGLKPARCHSYDVANARVRRERRFTYACDCQTIQEPARTHFKLQRGEIWSKCTGCGKHPKFMPDTAIRETVLNAQPGKKFSTNAKCKRAGDNQAAEPVLLGK